MNTNIEPLAHWQDTHYRQDPCDALAEDIGQDALGLVNDDESITVAVHDLLDEADPLVVRELATLLRQAIDGRGYPALKQALLRSLSQSAADAIQERAGGDIHQEYLARALAYVFSEISYGLLSRVKP